MPKFVPASREELIARGVLPAEEAPAEKPVEEKPKAPAAKKAPVAKKAPKE